MLSLESNFMRALRVTTALVLAAWLTVGCAKIEALRASGGNADGFQGGDPLYAKVAASSRTVQTAFQTMVTATAQDARVCTFTACNQSKPYCQMLRDLTAAQINDCRALLYDAATLFTGMLSTIPGSSPVPFRLKPGPLRDPQLGDVVAAYTTNSETSEVNLDRARVQQMTNEELMALIVHELGHKYGSPNYIQDRNARGNFVSGRLLLDTAGAALVAYALDILSLEIGGSTQTVNTNLAPVFLPLPNGDLMKVTRSLTQSGYVEVEIASALTAYREIRLKSVLPFGLAHARVCKYEVKGWDLVCVLTSNSGSNNVEFHTLSVESNYTMFNMHLAINHPLPPFAETLEFRFTPTEAYMIKRSPTGSGTVEFHPLSASSSYQQYVAHWGSDIPESDGPNVEFVSIGDDLLAIRPLGGASGNIEVQYRQRAKAFQTSATYTLPYSVGGNRAAYFWGVRNRDLMVIKARDTVSNSVEIDLLSEISGYTSFLQRLVSGFRLR